MRTKEKVIEKIKKEFAGDPAKRDELLKSWEQKGKHPEHPKKLAAEAHEEASKSGRIGLPYYFSYDSYSQSADNTCGQAAIASAVDYYGLNPYNLQRKFKGADGRLHFMPDEILGNVFRDFGPNWPLMNCVTVRETIMSAFNTYGLKCDEGYTPAFGNGEDVRADLKNWMAANRPVIVLLDQGSKMFGGPAYVPHWCTVFGYDDNYVYVSSLGDMITATWQDFMDAWHCWFLPYPNNYYMLGFWK